MPVMVFYKDKSVSNAVAQDIITNIAKITSSFLDAKMEMRVVEPILAYNANEVHIEMRFRDFKEWTDEALQTYHDKIMATIGSALKQHKVSCSYSFYIVPSMPPRSVWAQDKS